MLLTLAKGSANWLNVQVREFVLVQCADTQCKIDAYHYQCLNHKQALRTHHGINARSF